MIKRTTIFSLIFSFLIGTGLFVIKNKVQELEDELKQLNREILVERTGHHVLKAEWSHLNEYNRIRNLSYRYLELKPLNSTQFITEMQIVELVDNTLNKKNTHNIKPNNSSFHARMNKVLNRKKPE